MAAIGKSASVQPKVRIPEENQQQTYVKSKKYEDLNVGGVFAAAKAHDSAACRS